MTSIDNLNNFNMSYLQNSTLLPGLSSAAISPPLFQNNITGSFPMENFDSFSLGAGQLGGFMPNIDFGKLLEYSMQKYNEQLALIQSLALSLGNFNNKNNVNNAPSLSGVTYNKDIAADLADAVKKSARGSSTGYCARSVSNALAKVGVSAERGDAYEMASNLAKNKNFKEVSISKNELANLPEGCILVYPKGSAGYSSSYGHIEVTLGDGSAASDYVNNNVKYSSDMRVFVPA